MYASVARSASRRPRLLAALALVLLVAFGAFGVRAAISSLVISPVTGTVKTHVNRIFSKLAVRNRVEAVIFAFDHGLTGSTPQRP